MPESAPNLSTPDFGINRNYATAGLPDNPSPGSTSAANPQLGRASSTLPTSFATSPIHGARYTSAVAREVYETVTTVANDTNPDFRMYKRDFRPVGSSNPLYTNPRDKNIDDSELKRLKLGTPFSPTVASPGAGNGVNPVMPAGRDHKGLIPQEAPQNSGQEQERLNPTLSQYQNLGEIPRTQVGSVRTFTLGVGSTVGANRNNPSR